MQTQTFTFLTMIQNYDQTIERMYHPENFESQEEVDEEGNCLKCGEQICVCDQLEEVTKGVNSYDRPRSN